MDKHPKYGTPIHDDPVEAADALHDWCEAEEMDTPRYVGVTNSVLRRVGHEWGLHPAVPYCWFECDSAETARAAEASLQECEGYVGGGADREENPSSDYPSVFVYCVPYDECGYFSTGWLRQQGLIDED